MPIIITPLWADHRPVPVTYVALQGESVSILNVFILEIIEVDLGEVGVDGDGVVVAHAGQPVVVHSGGGAAMEHILNAML